ncbi:MAG: glycoside hydrolase family 55 protein [Acidiferrobacterales bacterium]|nr:glycoside hydrolase family 55 protein [Acidiferrobacterales bacterium]
MRTQSFQLGRRGSYPLSRKNTVVSQALLAIAILCYSTLANATPTILDLATDGKVRLPDFSYAGYKHGVEPIPLVKQKVINVADYGAVANDGRDDSKAILKALEKAHAIDGSVVVAFPQGQLIISEILRIKRGNIVLRGVGSGEGGTSLFFPRPLKMIDKGESLKELTEYLSQYDKRQKEKHNNINELFSEYSWTGGFIWVQKRGYSSGSLSAKV